MSPPAAFDEPPKTVSPGARGTGRAASKADTPTQLDRGTWLGRYEVLRPLGAGGMGQVYLARTQGLPGFEKLVALKRVLPEHDARADFAQMLLHEARLMASLHHPAIAQVYDAAIADEIPFMVMEYVHGESLAKVLVELARRGRGLSLKNALWIVSSVAAALHYAHEKLQPDGAPWRIVHRDVSPNNVMITFDGTVKVIDFGVAKAVAQRTQTRPGTLKGNLRYMSPEQFLGTELDRKSDIFSLGIVLFELTTGTRWQRERDDQLAAQAMLHNPLPRPSERRSGYPHTLESIVLKALARDPAQRFATAQELQQALQDFASQQNLVLSNIELGGVMQTLFAERARSSTQRELLAEASNPKEQSNAVATNAEAQAAQFGPNGTLLLSEPIDGISGPEPEVGSASAAAEPHLNEGAGRTLRLAAEDAPALPEARRLPLTAIAVSLALALVAGLIAVLWTVR
ncbi:MAG TPA: serine/threonine-protein kinase [Polyangiaceae bacterium]|jgi:serine/threonine protein kinase|nr:serine/threonine-protein kinase [Polyangiaceae bacterium]